MATSLESNYAQPTESLLGFADETVDDLRLRLLAAMRFTFSWMNAVEGSDNQNAWWARIKTLQENLLASMKALPPEDIFPRNAAVVQYEATSRMWSELWRDLQLSADTLPRPDLLEQLGSYADAVIKAPGAAALSLIEQLTNEIKKLLGGTVAAIWAALWPFLLVGGAVGAAYVFRAPLGRVLGRVTK